MEDQTKHTPGPWRLVEELPDQNMGGFIGGDGTVVCTFGDAYQYESMSGNPPNDPNARLIAAAPELLEAAKTVLFPSDDLRAAIAKAEGR